MRYDMQAFIEIAIRYNHSNLSYLEIKDMVDRVFGTDHTIHVMTLIAQVMADLYGNVA